MSFPRDAPGLLTQPSPSVPQEAYSVARQFNLIPPICEQAEYHMFQREKVEVQLPELFHKIGGYQPTLLAPLLTPQGPSLTSPALSLSLSLSQEWVP